MGQTYMAVPNADGDEARTLRPLQAAAITYRIAFGPRAGQKIWTLHGAMAREGMARERLCCDIDGFSLHAAVRVDAHERKPLEQLCRYITDRRWQTRECSSTMQVRWSSSSRPLGATAPRT